MQVNEQLVQAITKEVLKQLQNRQSGQNTEKKSGCSQPSSTESLQGKTRMRPKHSYEGYVQAQKGTNPKEIVIGVGAAFQTEITKTISGIPLDQVLKNVRAGIEEEGMVSRVVKVLDTSDVAFMALESAKLSGSGIGIGIQSKGTTVIHQKDLYPLTNLELFPQAPLITLDMYRKIGRNAAKYVKGEKVTPIESFNDPMVRAKYQIKAALMHIIETEQLDPEKKMIEWEERK
ncbi:MAG: propanediol/glycerol family dehydratase medium subunit [Oliverpabstia sp.]|nr:propanediol/glycerol family dehydratase medium subunit [Eubacterium sp.]MDY2595074.1 propanediol/glycerol family dehydratase medium subunit [Oliverpabstia sp.]